MKKILSYGLLISSVLLTGCSLMKQDNNTPAIVIPTTGNEQHSGSDAPLQTGNINPAIDVAMGADSKLYHFTYDTASDNLIAHVDSLQLDVIFDYESYREICGKEGETCGSTGVLPRDYYLNVPVVVKENTIYDIFTIYAKDPNIGIVQTINEKFGITSSTCNLSTLAINTQGRIASGNSTLYTPNYRAFFDSSAGSFDYDLLDQRCKGMAKHEVYYAPTYPDRFILENAAYEIRQDDLFGFIRMRYTD